MIFINFGCRFIEIFISHIIFSGSFVPYCCHWSNNLQIDNGKHRDPNTVSKCHWFGILLWYLHCCPCGCFCYICHYNGKKPTLSLCTSDSTVVACDLYPNNMIWHMVVFSLVMYMVCVRELKIKTKFICPSFVVLDKMSYILFRKHIIWGWK